MSIEAQRQQLAKLYISVLASDGIQATHKLLSAAIIEHRRGAKSKKVKAPVREVQRKPPPQRGPTTIEHAGRTLTLGDAMRRLNHKQQAFVLAVVHDGLGAREAELAAGYSAGGSTRRSPYIQAAIAEERGRVM